ncbi:hypothetical protein H9Y04_14935 [Streptomyces sp. TRM66268-LWL]|uniref:Uncharacterized protein n=1 Tax=Streptomyces polyasparticus TaxID=2767826 RepID=A0ABR7SFV2_9ACTN|nr:hypothetical protein [Streptomyces polyasparticus]MBC9713864.1 hypothetical protein [Streptomyces polyasparticus]
MVLRPREGTAAEPVSLRFRIGSGPEADPQARLILYRDGRPLPEGHWDVHIQQSVDGRSRRVHAGSVETSRLVGLSLPHPSGAGWASTIPYVTADGHLALRTWNRPEHAELDTVTATSEVLTVTGTLHGADTAGRGYRLAARMRGTDSVRFHTPCRIEAGHTFTADIALHQLAGLHPGHSAVWDIHLTPHDPGRSLRPARLFGDLPDRKGIDQFPAAHLALPHGSLTVQAQLTADNNLALRTHISTRPRPAAELGGARQDSPHPAL